MGLKRYQKLIGILRISMGWLMLWAFLDKTFGLGFTTARESAWVNGVSPTAGFLQFATKGPFAGIFQSLAGNIIIDWLVMLGFLLIGIGLILGLGVKLSGYGGALMMALFYIAGFLPPEHNPIIDEHITWLLVFLLLAWTKSGRWYGFGTWWSKLNLVKKHRIFE